GPASAAFGDAQSGIISLITRSGGPRLAGDFAYETDNLFGSGVSLGLNRFEGGVGGTVADRLAFFLGGTLAGQLAGTDAAGVDQTQAFVPGATDTVVTDTVEGVPREVQIPRFVQYSGDCDARANAGASCHGRTLPYDWSTQVSLSGKVEWRYGAGSSVALTGLHHVAQDRFWAGRLAFNPATHMGSRSTGTAWILSWTQVLPGLRGPTVQVALSRQSARVVSGPFEAEWAASHQEPTAGIVLSRPGFLVDFDRFSADTGAGAITRLESDEDWDRLVNNVVTNVGTRVPYLNREDLRLAQPYRLNPWAAETGFPTQGTDVEASLADQRHWLGRGVITWPWARGARLRIGAEHTRSRVNSFSSGLLRQNSMSVYAEDPIQTGVFAEQRYEADGLLLSVGLRWDTFDPRTVFPVTPGRLFSNPSFDPTDPYGSASGVFAPAESRSALSPRVRLAWTAPTGTTMRLGYAGSARHPDLTAMFTGKNRDLAFSSTAASLGGPLDWERSRHIEAGIRQQLGSRVAVDAAGYLVRKVSDAALTVQAFPDPLQGRDIAVVVPGNLDTGTVKGLELTLSGQPTPWLDFQVGYTLADARGTITAYQNRKHALAGWLVARGPDRGRAGSWVGRAVSQAQAALRFRVSSGLPYFPLMNAGNGQIAPGGDLGDIAGQRRDTPGIKSLDLRIARGFRTAGVGWSVYADVRNLLDWRNEYRVFAETGDVENETHRQRVRNPELERLINDAGARWIQITV
ncbi:MAG TPA: TonB-dependent receptor, partial [Gemmatimonadales bacterium]|nr:TonB-dependent receptor [Gemmatimonadales bacterium]